MVRPVSTVLYLYGFVPSGATASGAGLAGLEGAEVRVLDLGALAAVVSHLDARDYSSGSIEAHLKDLGWLADRGAHHERIVTWFSDHTTIVPARFLTVFSSEQALRAEAQERQDEITTRLRRFRDVREWDLKVSYDLDTLSSHLGQLSEKTAALDSEIEAAAPGRRYLLERRRDEVARSEAGGVARHLARQLLDDLRSHVEEVAELELPSLRDDLPVVLNAALLVRTEEAGALERAAGEVIPELEARGLHVGLTGPWAPYRFMREDAGV
jgi:hypothetical protein